MEIETEIRTHVDELMRQELKNLKLVRPTAKLNMIAYR